MVISMAEQRNTNWPAVDGAYNHYDAWGIAASWRVTNTSKLLFVTLDPSCDVPEGIHRGMVSMEFAPSWLNEEICPVGTAVNLELVKPADKRFEDGIARFKSIREDSSHLSVSKPLQEVSNTLPVVIPSSTSVREKMVISAVDKNLKCKFLGRCIALQVNKAQAIEEAMQLWLKKH
jgi:hypothetical protein